MSSCSCTLWDVARGGTLEVAMQKVMEGERNTMWAVARSRTLEVAMQEVVEGERKHFEVTRLAIRCGSRN